MKTKHIILLSLFGAVFFLIIACCLLYVDIMNRSTEHGWSILVSIIVFWVLFFVARTISLKSTEPNKEHTERLIKLYESQLKDSSSFMKIVLTEAIRKLKVGHLDPERVENWVVKLEKDFRNF